MKVAVSCDAIVSRNYITGVIESVLALYEDAELYCIVHKTGGILGPIEQRRIQSTYLSNIIDDDYSMGESWWKKSFLIPGACKNLTVPCNVDLLINISSGFSQGIAKCEGVYQVTYLVENAFDTRVKSSIRERIFSSYVENWATKKMAQSDELWVTNEHALDFWSKRHENVSVMPPFFKASDYPLFSSAVRKSFPRDFLCFESPSFDESQAFALIEECIEVGLKYKFVGRDDHLKEGKCAEYAENFFGERCSGELAPMLAACRGFISLQSKGFPSTPMSALSTGTPIALSTQSEGLQYFKKAKGVFEFAGFDGLKSNLSTLFKDMDSLDPTELHNQTNRFHDLKFRGEFIRRMKVMGPELASKRSASNC